jgi:hypothetical protein
VAPDDRTSRVAASDRIKVEIEVVEILPFGLVTARPPDSEQSLPEGIVPLIRTAPTTEVKAGA